MTEATKKLNIRTRRVAVALVLALSCAAIAKAAIAAQESAKTSATATRRVRIFNFLVASVMIPQPAFRDFSPQGEKPIPPAESKQEAGHGRVGATLRCFQVLRRWKFSAILRRAKVFA